MKTILAATALAAGVSLLSLAASPALAGGPVAISYYSGFVDTGSSITFSGYEFTDYVSSINEYADYGGTNSDPAWPGGYVNFGANFTASVNVATAGDYTFDWGTDDGGYLFVDGNLIGSEPGIHAFYSTDSTVFLNAGVNTIDLEYYNGEATQAAAVVNLPEGVAYVPEPAAWWVMLAGFAGIGAALRTSRRRHAVA